MRVIYKKQTFNKVLKEWDYLYRLLLCSLVIRKNWRKVREKSMIWVPNNCWMRCNFLLI